MKKYLLIESHSPYESSEASNDYQLAIELAQSGNDTTLFLVQNGVLPARKNSSSGHSLDSLLQNGVKVVCDEFSLRERGIYSDAIAAGIETGPLDIDV